MSSLIPFFIRCSCGSAVLLELFLWTGMALRWSTWKEGEINAWIFFHIKMNLAFSIVLCLPFVFHWVLFLSLVFTPFFQVSWGGVGERCFFFLPSYMFYLFPEELCGAMTDMSSFPSLQYWARSTIYFMFVFLLSIACSQCSLFDLTTAFRSVSSRQKFCKISSDPNFWRLHVAESCVVTLRDRQ